MNTFRMPDLGTTMRHMQSGNLAAATVAIQQALATAPVDGERPLPGSSDVVLEGVYERVDEPMPASRSPAFAGEAERRQHSDGSFSSHRFTCTAGSRAYKLYTPPNAGDLALPLIVMLHGCTQSPDDFARGTRMNHFAREHGFLVAYPAQDGNTNVNRCWNWFMPDHQQRGHGEPAILAALATSLCDDARADPSRVYVAGLSAGAAMAVVLGNTYPDVFAAIGVHSGVPYRAATDVASAFSAMQGNTLRTRAPAAAEIARCNVPTIVFHGDQDKTVNAINGERIASATIRGASPATAATDARVETDAGIAGGRHFERTRHVDYRGVVVTEHWLVKGGGHAWFGGDPAGTFTDANGPDASAEMMRFFNLHA